MCFFDGERVARRDTNSGVFYYFSDHLKTASVETDASGNIKDESDFYPWGGELQFTNSNDNHYKFTGKERNTETNLDYLGARYYTNSLGRFITPDWSATPEPVPYAHLDDPQSLNQYTYVRNIPTTLFDPAGHAPPPSAKCFNGECSPRGFPVNCICGGNPAPTDVNGKPVPPPTSLPNRKNGDVNKWVIKSRGKGSRVKWGPKFPVKTEKGGQPSASWDDDHGHWGR